MILKEAFYDDFYCTADKCPVCCCYGLEITMNREETQRYTDSEGSAAIDNLTICKDGTSVIKHDGADGGCGFLTKDGLCSLVLKHGEMFLNETCHVFPRFEYYYNDIEEKYLSNACPAVLDFLINSKNPLEFVTDDEEVKLKKGVVAAEISDTQMQYRDALIDVIQAAVYPLWLRLFLLKRHSDKLSETGDYNSCMADIYSKNLNENLYDALKPVEVNDENQLKILNALIGSVISEKNRRPNKNADIVYKYLSDAKGLFEKPIKETIGAWKRFKKLLEEKYENFFENFCVNHLFMHSWYLHIGDEQNFTVKNLILEYALIRAVLFMSFIGNEEKMNMDDFYKIVVFMARHFEHGRKNTVAYIKDNASHECLSNAAFFEMIR